MMVLCERVCCSRLPPFDKRSAYGVCCCVVYVDAAAINYLSPPCNAVVEGRTPFLTCYRAADEVYLTECEVCC